MTPQDRAHSYVQQMDLQRSKMFHAYAKLCSYYSKMINKPELQEAISEDDRAQMQKNFA